MLGSERLERCKAQWYPNRYHGWGRYRNYFEGWYFKMVAADGSIAMSVIPGISMDAQGSKHAFIQVIDGTKAISAYHEFDFHEFESSRDQFSIRIGENHFDLTNISLRLNNLKGDVEMLEHTPWPKKFGAPGIMGWYSFVPFMQCYHGVLSMHHQLQGSLNLDGFEHNFDGGTGYVEKDWGTSFPKSWIWMQTNNFGNSKEKVSLMASVAHIPWMGRYFVGFLVGIYVGGQLYQFTTHNNAKLNTRLDESNVYMELQKGRLKLSIVASKAKTAELVSPISGDMRGKVNESIDARIKVKLTDSNETVYEGNGKHAGLEIAGDVSILLGD